MLPRIAINGRFLTRPITGVERVAREITRALGELYDQHGQREDVFILAPNTRLHDPDLPVPIRTVGRTNGQLWEQIELPFFARSEVLFSPCNIGPLLHPRAIVTINDAQVHLSPHSYRRSFRALYRILQPMVARTSQMVTVPSRYSMTELRSRRVLSAKEPLFLPYGHEHILRIQEDQSIKARVGLHEHTKYVFAIGSRSAHKNIGVLLQAAKLVSNDVLIVVAGDRLSHIFSGDLEAQSSNVRFIGRVTDGEMKALMRGALCLAFPSLTEGFGLPPLEAMAIGCPVIASPRGAIPEVCASAVIYADPYDPQQWAHHIGRLAASISLRETLSLDGMERASALTWRASARILTEAICARFAPSTSNIADIRP